MITFNELFDYGKNNKHQFITNTIHDVPWVDKYRPTKLGDIVYQDDVVKMLSKVLETGNLPHLLFYGHAGTGKTSTILAIGMELFGPKKYKERVIELNASDERGINIVRNKIVNLAKMTVSSNDPNYICPPYKIIVLDEADAMTNEAQSALRKTMEDNSSVTRFCFICNYINQIIDPITSRCVKFRFKPINGEQMITKLRMIANNENLMITDRAMDTISQISNGDMRKGIMFLQNLNYLGKKIQSGDVFQIANMISYSKLSNVINICVDNHLDIQKLRFITNKLIKCGYPINVTLQQLTDMIVKNEKLTEFMKAQICYHIAMTEKRLIDGADEYLQMLSIFMFIKKITNSLE